MRIFWLASRKWKRDDLEGKLVEFRITYSDAVADGVGKFLVRGNGVAKMAIDIVVLHPQEYYSTYYHLTDSLASQIERHPDGSVAQFRCVGLFSPTSPD